MARATRGGTVGVRRHGEGAPKRPWPEQVPVECLGFAGRYLYVLDSQQQFAIVDTERITRARLVNLATPDALLAAYPRKRLLPEPDGSKVWVTVGWQMDEFLADLEDYCKYRGIFDPVERLRGRGAFAGEDGHLLLHLGDALFTRGRLLPLGKRGEYVYSLAPPLPRPYLQPAIHAADGPAIALLDRVSHSWSFRRTIDPYIWLGMLGVVIAAGALPARPGCALTGERGTGKTELMRLSCNLLRNRLVYSTDLTEAGIRQRLGRDSIGVMLDEFEASGDPHVLHRLILYWRSCYSGGRALRGGSHHTGSEFITNAVLIAAAIDLPALDAADRSRVVIVNLDKLSAGAKAKLADDPLLPEIGAWMVRRMADQFLHLRDFVLPAWRDLLTGAGWDDRGADTYGIVLSCAWIMLRDDIPNEADLGRFASDLEELAEAHEAEETASHIRACTRLYAWRPEQFQRGGDGRTIGEMLTEGAGWADDGLTSEELPAGFAPSIERTELQARRVAASDNKARKSAKQLRRYGLAIVAASEDSQHGGAPGRWWRAGERLLAIAVNSPHLADCFRGSPWGGTDAGAGGWSTVFLRAPGATRGRPMRFGYGESRVVLLRLDVALAGLVGPEGQDMAQVWQQAPR